MSNSNRTRKLSPARDQRAYNMPSGKSLNAKMGHDVRARGELRREVAMQDFDALQVGPMAALQAGARLAQPLGGCTQAGRIPQLKEAPVQQNSCYDISCSLWCALSAERSICPAMSCYDINAPHGVPSPLQHVFVSHESYSAFLIYICQMQFPFPGVCSALPCVVANAEPCMLQRNAKLFKAVSADTCISILSGPDGHWREALAPCHVAIMS